MLNVITWGFGVALALMCLMVALRSFGMEKISVRGRSWALAKPVDLQGEPFTRAMGVSAVLWGIGVLCAYYLASAVFCAVTKQEVSWEGLYQVWKQWDATNYRTLAEFGYRDYTDEAHLYLVHLPLYPWLVRLLAKVIPNYNLCGHVLSSLCFVGSCYVLARLTTEEFGRQTSRLTLMLFSAYPWAFFFAAYYTESLFMLLSVTAFYFIRKRRYPLVGIFSALAALTRLQGILLAVVAVVEYIVYDRPVDKLRAKDWRGLGHDCWFKLRFILWTAVGVIVYLGLNYAVEGNPFQFMIYQKENWFQGYIPLPRCLETIHYYMFARWPGKASLLTWWPEWILFFVSFAVAVYALRRFHPTWMTYLLTAFIMNYSLSWPLSVGRYMACTFPMFVAIAIMFRRRPGAVQCLTVIGTLIEGAFLFAFLSGSSVL